MLLNSSSSLHLKINKVLSQNFSNMHFFGGHCKCNMNLNIENDLEHEHGRGGTGIKCA
jgi:hypothetical protein